MGESYDYLKRLHDFHVSKFAISTYVANPIKEIDVITLNKTLIQKFALRLKHKELENLEIIKEIEEIQYFMLKTLNGEEAKNMNVFLGLNLLDCVRCMEFHYTLISEYLYFEIISSCYMPSSKEFTLVNESWEFLMALMSGKVLNSSCKLSFMLIPIFESLSNVHDEGNAKELLRAIVSGMKIYKLPFNQKYIPLEVTSSYLRVMNFLLVQKNLISMFHSLEIGSELTRPWLNENLQLLINLLKFFLAEQINMDDSEICELLRNAVKLVNLLSKTFREWFVDGDLYMPFKLYETSCVMFKLECFKNTPGNNYTKIYAARLELSEIYCHLLNGIEDFFKIFVKH